MFTGLVEGTAQVHALEASAGGVRLRVRVAWMAGDVALGDSVAVNGCCLTVAAREGDVLCFDLLQETLSRTSLSGARAGDRVNVERALAAGSRLGGHFVQGHVDCTAEVLAVSRSGPDLRVEMELPGEGAAYLVPKGSIAVDGISLTVAELHRSSFVLWIIPHTLEKTNLGDRVAGDRVNLEYDILAKYVERMLTLRAQADRGGLVPPL